MNKERYEVTSESVSEGHPDKLADQISDAILDEIIAQDPHARVACDTLLSHDLIVVAGEITTIATYDIREIVYRTIEGVGYTTETYGCDFRKCKFIEEIEKQSPDIAQGVDQMNDEIGAGDQGIMYGYACTETKELMPLPITLANQMLLKHAQLRKKGILKWLRPDAKSQITIIYENGRPSYADNIILSTQHDPGISHNELEEAVIEKIIKPVIGEFITNKTKYHINPTGKFVFGGPKADTGLTGRKTVIDTYGGVGLNGGGAFSGKDPTKVDRSANYMARYIAKNIIAAGLGRKCTVGLAYAIGLTYPTSVQIDLHGTGKIDEEVLEKRVRKIFDLTPRGMIESLNLLRPIYQKTAAYGHFGREIPEFSWERTDKKGRLI